VALKATIFKATLNIADMDRNHYAEHALTIARHPSETDERMMVRVLVFAMHAHERLELGKGLSDPDEPDLWRRDLTGLIEEWIELGQPDERDVIRACGRAGRVFVYGYNHAAKPWWELNEVKLARAKNLSVRRLQVEGEGGLAVLANRTMQLHCTIQDGDIWLGDGDKTLAVRCETLRA
jgi:uncharacterized protein YaeQ